MKRHAGVVMVAAALSLALPLAAFAREGKVRGKFVRLTEKKIGEREYVGVVIAPEEGREQAIVFMGRDSRLLPAARKLRKGQQVEIAYVTEGEQKWAKRIGAEARDRRVRGKFLGLDEKKVGEREYIAVVVQPLEGKDKAVLLTGRGSDAAARARKLRKGQQVEITYVTEGGQKWIKRIGTPARQGQVRGKLVRLTEKKVGEREHLAVVVQPRDSDDEVVVLVGRRSEFAARARKLKKGQQVEITYVVEGEQKWARRVEAAGAPGSKDERVEKQWRAEIRVLRARLKQMEKELKAIRMENAKLKKQLREKREATASE